jgi:hypothetical protein
MMPYQLAWFIFLLPVFSFVIITFFFRLFLNDKPRLGGYTIITALLGSFALSIWALVSVLAAPEHELPVPDISWVVIEGGVTIHLGIIMDSLTAVMLIVHWLLVPSSGSGQCGEEGFYCYPAWRLRLPGRNIAPVFEHRHL